MTASPATAVSGQVTPEPTVTFEAQYRAEYGPMVRLAYLLTGSVEVAHDITHDAFVRISGRFGQVDNPGGYLRQSVVNLARDHHRSRTRRARMVPTTAPPAVLPPEVDETWEAVQDLPVAHRTAVVLRFYSDLTYDQIAELTGSPVGTVKANVHRGLGRLRQMIDGRS